MTGQRPRRLRGGGREHLTGWTFVLPAAVLIAVFGVIPVGWSLVLSFQHNDLLTTPSWVGLGNYRALTHDPLFRSAIWHTVVYTLLFVPISIAGALAIAVALNRKIRFIRFYRTAAFVPVVFSTVATAITFNWLLEPNYGLVDYGLERLGLPAQGFFQDPNQALYAVVAMTVWGWLGFDVIIYLAALQAVPRELLEAAAIDGAGRLTTFRRIVVPLLGPATLFLVVWSTINALQLFDQAFHFFNGGYAAAIAYTLFIAILALTGIQLWVGARRVHYGSS